MTDFVEQLAATSLLEWLAVLFAIGYVWLAARQNNWCWSCAFLSTSIYVYLFWQVTLPFQAVLNVFYMIMAVYGYWQWRRGEQSDTTTMIRSFHWTHHLLLVVALASLGWALSYFASSQFNSDYLLLDASLQVFSVVTTFMVAHKVLENWIYWFFINIASAYLYFQSGLVLSACLYIGYVGFSVYGYIKWQQERTRSLAVTP